MQALSLLYGPLNEPRIVEEVGEAVLEASYRAFAAECEEPGRAQVLEIVEGLQDRYRTRAKAPMELEAGLSA
jgi:hypothetical protein